MTTSKAKAKGSRAERKIAADLKGIRVGQDGGPVDVLVRGYLQIQAKTLKTLPSLNDVRTMIEAMPPGPELRAAVILARPGSGHRAKAWIVFDYDEWKEWHG
jgi:hypothetical protein